MIEKKFIIPILLYLYNIIMSAFSLLMFLYSLLNKHNIKYNQRTLKTQQIKNFNSKLIWIHGASLGEIKSIATLLKELQVQYPTYQILITSNTTTSQNLLSKDFTNIIYQFLPYDCKFLVKKFLKIYNPSLAIFLEQDFFPIFLHSL